MVILWLFCNRCLILRSTQCKKAVELPLSLGSKPSFQVIFHVICLFSINEDVTKNVGKSLEISQEKFYDGVSFSKVTNLKCSDCNFAIEITHHRYFWNMYLKLDVLKKIFLRKKSMMDALLIKLQSCSTQFSILS